MSRRYEEQVEVRLGAATEHGVRVEGALPTLWTEVGAQAQKVPTVFLWRGRVHLVRAVLGQWSQRVPWWRAEDHDGEDLERRVWRVEAGAGQSMGTGVYDLVQDDRWWLARVSD
ncbi:DUF6504 family protein [Ornithinimicrobium pratense]|uniref:DUF6504 domain-containing protein n=1 Tax=Ornithinimicrobium pratense TaxID=2593973 RepID=A0A5J6V3N9_9MICO|nr:DUF6504 family protein [Ornithinimicrobium pratense]QFG68257.1 hypothetical protein FY030_05580 [Ornithinimicrobium pratense]